MKDKGTRVTCGRFIRRIVMTLPVMLSLGCGPGRVMGLAAQAPAFPTELALRLDEEIEAWAGSPSHLGVSAAVILPDAREWVGTAGIEAEGRPLRPEHLIWIASITKTMTGALILTLAEDGRLDLDDPVSRWLDLPNVDPEITVRQLLNHTSGVANYTASPHLGPAINADTTHVFSPDELAGFIGPPAFRRGARTQYTNTSFLLLGMIAHRVTGRPITDLWRQRLWAPLDLEEVFLPGLQEPPGPVARAWTGRGATQEVAPLGRMSLLSIGHSAMGLFSNARTVARWGRALFSGEVLCAGMRAEMLEFVAAAGNIPGESGAGLGIRKYAYLGREQWGHSGGSPLGSSLMLYDDETGITVVVIMNQGPGADHFVLAPRLLELTADHVPFAPGVPTSAAASAHSSCP